MPLTIRDAESSFLQAKATVEDWQGEFLRTWLQPELDLTLIAFWSNLDPLVKQNLQKMQPEAYSQVEQQVQQAKERYQNG